MPQHTALNVYGEMLMQITMDFPGISDPRTLSISEILFWYNGCRPALRKATAPK